MKRSPIWVLLGLCLFVFGCSTGSSSDEDSNRDAGVGTDLDADTDTDVDSVPDTDTDTGDDSGSNGDSDTDADTDSGCTTGWYDNSTNLCWQEPPPAQRFTWYEAYDYCESLDIGDHDTWRLPKIHELITLIRGCGSQDCRLHDPNCLSNACSRTISCVTFCDVSKGPGIDGCYWNDAFGGSCDKGIWSSSLLDLGNVEESENEAAWQIRFSNATIIPYGVGGPKTVRCVRSGP